MLTKREFDKQAKLMQKHAGAYLDAIGVIKADWIERTGIDDWSTVDCDSLIDAFEFGCGAPAAIPHKEFISICDNYTEW